MATSSQRPSKAGAKARVSVRRKKKLSINEQTLVQSQEAVTGESTRTDTAKEKSTLTTTELAQSAPSPSVAAATDSVNSTSSPGNSTQSLSMSPAQVSLPGVAVLTPAATMPITQAMPVAESASPVEPSTSVLGGSSSTLSLSK